MDDRHEPRPDFVAHLEWQVRTALRRQDRFTEPTRRHGGSMKLASVVLVSALIGAGGMVVSDEVQENRRQELLLARVDTELRLAELQVAMVRTQLEAMEEQRALGVVGDEALLSARVALREGQSHLEALTLDREEIRITGREPGDGVDAPLVDGRDFVTERLQLRLSVREQHLELAELQLSRLRDLEDAGVIPEEQARQGVLALEEARIQRESLAGQVEIRARFLEGDLSGDAAVREAAILDANRDLRVQEMAHDFAARRLQRLEERAERGLLHPSEMERARLEVMQMELAQELVLLRLRELRGGEQGG